MTNTQHQYVSGILAVIIAVLLGWAGAAYSSMARELHELQIEFATVRAEQRHLNQRLDAYERRTASTSPYFDEDEQTNPGAALESPYTEAVPSHP